MLSILTGRCIAVSQHMTVCSKTKITVGSNAYSHKTALLLSAICLSLVTGCHTVKGPQTAPVTTAAPSELSLDASQPIRLTAFSIRGKIGVVSPKIEGARGQSGSAFYIWSQEDDRFAIDIAGALGIGHTVIEYNGETAVLKSQSNAEVYAEDPEELLTRATGWQAPISQLPYWISGHVAPSDSDYTLDTDGRLQTAINGDWTAYFTYDIQAYHLPNSADLPDKIRIVRPDDYRVILTIEHDTNQ